MYWKKAITKLTLSKLMTKARGGTEWWEMGLWMLKNIREKTDHSTCPIGKKEGELGHIWRCKGTRSWRDEFLD
jgi:hypothetical protein